MQIFHSQNDDASSGFTLIECILAVGVLAMGIASIIALQSSIVSTTRLSANKIWASWAMRSAIEQAQYVLDVQGQAVLPENKTYLWSNDENFSITISRKDLKDIKPSHFLLTALKVSHATDPKADENQDLDRTMAPIAAMLDNSVQSPRAKTPSGGPAAISAQSYFCNLNVRTDWTEGTSKRSLSSTLFLIDPNVLSNFNPPSNNNASGSQSQQGNGQSPGAQPGGK